jgi:sugar-specific transcriptional regulator TrmB
MNFSPQSQAIYQVLLNANQPLTAKDLSCRLRIPSSLVYRLIKPLIAMGLASKTKPYPYLFSAKPAGEGLSMYLLFQNEWFSKQFSSAKQNLMENSNSESNGIGFSFIQGRDELMKKSAEELDKTTKSADILRSGGEIPAETMLAMFKAIKREVKIRMLIQNYSDQNRHDVEYWKKNGILVRQTPLHHLRLMLYDSKIIYFMSYRHDDSGKDTGMKIDYAPFAAILSRLFDEWWQKAEIIQS